jgi:phosphoglycolate phosphatase
LNIPTISVREVYVVLLTLSSAVVFKVLFLLIGLYGSGKTTISSFLAKENYTVVSFDSLDKDTREKDERIRVIFGLFTDTLGVNKEKPIGFFDFREDYLQIFAEQSGSLINTLEELQKNYHSKNIVANVVDLEHLRRNVLIPSLLKISEQTMERVDTQNSTVIDAGAMHFLSMDHSYLNNLGKNYDKTVVIYLGKSIAMTINDLFKENNGHFLFLERGFRKDIIKLLENDFNTKLPTDYKAITNIINARPEIKQRVRLFVENMLLGNEVELEKYISQWETSETAFFRVNRVVIKDNETLVSTVNRAKDVIHRESVLENILLTRKPSAVIFDLSSTILDSHAKDLDAIDHVLLKNGLPTWKGGTKAKKDQNLSMKDNFPNFFGSDLAKKAYEEYFQYLIEKLPEMSLVDGAKDTLNYFKGTGTKIIMITNRDRKFVDEFLDDFKMGSYFDAIVAAGDTPYTKPDPEMLKDVFGKLKLNTEKDEVLFVGDAHADVNCAIKSGCTPVLMRAVVTDVSNRDIVGMTSVESSRSPLRIFNSHRDFLIFVQQSEEECELSETGF